MTDLDRHQPAAGPGAVDGRRRAFGASGGEAEARVALADATRRLNDAVVGARVPPEVLWQVAAAVADAERTLRHAASGRWPRTEPDVRQGAQALFPTSPVVGRANPIAPPVEVAVADGGIVGRGVLVSPYEGPPGCVHGGVVAMAMDDLLGAATIVAGHPGMTGTLTVRFHRPTPLETPLTFEARAVAVDGRKVRAEGAVRTGDQVTATADGIFVAVDPARFDQVRPRG